MTREQFHDLTSAMTYPAVVRTTGGRRYLLEDETSFHFVSRHPGLVFLFPAGRGVIALSFEAIESVDFEHAVETRN